MRGTGKREIPVLIMLTVFLSLILASCSRRETTVSKTVIHMESDGASGAKPKAEPDFFDLYGTDWYGWFRIYDADGVWEKLNGAWWDCCGRISGEQERYITVWTRDLPMEQYLARFWLSFGEYGIGCLKGEMLSRSLSAPCTVSFDEDMKLLVFECRHYTPSDGAFGYTIYLKPWGELWDENREDPPADYKSWYLPLIEAGDPMPDTME